MMPPPRLNPVATTARYGDSWLSHDFDSFQASFEVRPKSSWLMTNTTNITPRMSPNPTLIAIWYVLASSVHISSKLGGGKSFCMPL